MGRPPPDDEKLGFHRIARFYYYPGWWEGSAQIAALASAALPQHFKDILETACNEQTRPMLVRDDVRNPEAPRRMVAQCVQIRPFSRAIMDAAYRASSELFEELARQDGDFRALYGSWRRFLEASNAWMRVAGPALDAYLYSNPLPSRPG